MGTCLLILIRINLPIYFTGVSEELRHLLTLTLTLTLTLVTLTLFLQQCNATRSKMGQLN